VREEPFEGFGCAEDDCGVLWGPDQGDFVRSGG
jgi:hypothetical protein